MKILRIGLAVVLAAYGLFSLFPVYCDIAWSAGWWTSVPPDIERMIPLWEATPSWMLAVWVVEIALLLLTAWRLVRGRPALMIYLGALVAEAAKWATMKSLPAYASAFTAQELQMDYVMLAILAAIGALIWWSERRRPEPAAA